jgi:ParB family chromosome partitioning protein
MKIKLSQIDLPEYDLRAQVDDEELDELASSLRDHGQLQSIGVKEMPNDRYEVVFGARRTRAAKILQWDEINAELVDEAGTISADAKKLIENVQRSQLTPIEEAFSLEKLQLETNADIRELQRQTGKTRGWVTSRLQMLTYPEDIQKALQNRLITLGVAEAFATIKNAEVRRQYLSHAIENPMSTAAAHAWASQSSYAEAGVLAMRDAEAMRERADELPTGVDQKYNCFACTGTRSILQVVQVVICKQCMDHILDNRRRPPETVAPLPVDTMAS